MLMKIVAATIEMNAASSAYSTTSWPLFLTNKRSN